MSPAVSGNRRLHLVVIAIALALVGAAYASALRGGFVYDDHSEIVRNPFIQDPRHFWTAMTSDVWAFKGSRDEPWSNYWRPLFVAWMALNYHLFGLDPTGWHVTSMALHALVTVLAYASMVRLNLPSAVCAFAAWVFAAHPVHVESVAWASGVPDLLMSAAMLGSYLCLLRPDDRPSATSPAAGQASARRRRREPRGAARRSAPPTQRKPRSRSWLSAACFLFMLALLSKEGAIAFPAIVLITHGYRAGKDSTKGAGGANWTIRSRAALRAVLPLVAVAVVYLIARFLVLGRMHRLPPGGATWLEAIRTAPLAMMFYLRQIVLPYELSPVYDVRIVQAGDWSFAHRWLPLLVSAALAVLLYRGIRRAQSGYVLGAALFLLPLALALNIRVFIPDQIVHDRYLYLPLLGALMILGTAAHDLSAWLGRGRAAVAHRGVMGLGMLAGVALAIVSGRYNPVWGDDVRLWERGIRVAPANADAHAELGEAYRRAGRLDDARRVLQRALEIDPALTSAHIILGMVANSQQRYDEAERYLQRVVEARPDRAEALEQLAVTLQQTGRFDQAIALFEAGRQRLPYRHTTYTVNIAVLHKLAGHADASRAELESIRDALASSTDPAQLKAWVYLGRLYADAGRVDDAIRALERYLASTAGISDPQVMELRASCATAIRLARADGR